MKKLLAVALTLLFFGMSIIPSSGIKIEQSTRTLFYDGNTLYVGGGGPGNYTLIQDAIDNASDGDTVFVYDDSSPYYENLVVKSLYLSLIGENKDSTILNGSGNGCVIYSIGSNFKISGLTIQNSGKYYSGIIINGCNNIITNNNISNNLHGIEIIDLGDNNTIANNNIISNNYFGIYVDYSSNNTISNNNISNNYFGLGIINSSSNTIIDNVISKNVFGLGFANSSSNTINDNTIKDNEGEGIYISYLNNSIITSNTLSNNDFGIFLEYGVSNTISGNIISNNEYGVGLLDSNNCIYHNNFINNRDINAFDACENIWDDGKYGNYWSDYKDKYPDAKVRLLKPWMWDIPYEIEGGDNKDNCPLVKQWPKPKSKDIPNNLATSSSPLMRLLDRYPLLNGLLFSIYNLFFIFYIKFNIF